MMENNSLENYKRTQAKLSALIDKHSYRAEIPEYTHNPARLIKMGESPDDLGNVKEALSNAQSFLYNFYDLLKELNIKFYSPHIFIEQDEEIIRKSLTKRRICMVVFEWAYGDRNLNLYFSVYDLYCLKAWGPSIFSDMEDFNIIYHYQVLPTYKWLIGEE